MGPVPFSLSSKYPIVDSMYTIESIPFGNPFRKIVKRKFDHRSFQLLENDDKELNHILESNSKIVSDFQRARRLNVREYASHCHAFNTSNYLSELRRQYEQLIEPTTKASVKSHETTNDAHLSEVKDITVANYSDVVIESYRSKNDPLFPNINSPFMTSDVSDSVSVVASVSSDFLSESSIVQRAVNQCDALSSFTSSLESTSLRKRPLNNDFFNGLNFPNSKRIKSILKQYLI
jgi:hypothetical protein